MSDCSSYFSILFYKILYRKSGEVGGQDEMIAFLVSVGFAITGLIYGLDNEPIASACFCIVSALFYLAEVLEGKKK